MPFIIAGVLYISLAVPALVVVGGVCLARRSPIRTILGGVAGSAAGFALGCVVSVIIGIGIVRSKAAVNIGATSIVIPVCLGGALLGSVAGGAVLPRSTRDAASPDAAH